MVKIGKQNRQVLVLYGSTFCSLLVGVLVSVLNTRSLSPEEYGDYQYVRNIVQFICGFLLFGYFISGSRLLAISKSDAHSRRIRGAMVAILIVSAAMLAVVLAATAFVHGVFMHKQVLATLLYFAILVGPNILFYNYINTTSQGDNHIFRMAVARLIPSVIYLVVAYFVFRYYGATSLRMLLLNGAISLVVYIVIIWSTKPDFKGLKESFKEVNDENKVYGFDVYLGSIANVGLAYLGSIMLGLLNTNNELVAFYTLAATIAQPLAMLPSIIGTVYFKRFANEEKISRKVMWGTFAITVLSFVAYIIMIHPVVKIFYDESYSIVSVYACFLALACCIQGYGDLINRFLGSHGKGREIRNAAIISGVILLLGNTVFVYFFDIEGAIAGKILGSIGACGTLVYYYRKYIKTL